MQIDPHFHAAPCQPLTKSCHIFILDLKLEKEEDIPLYTVLAFSIR